MGNKKDLSLILLGAAINALGLSAIIRPNEISNGGFVGLSIIVNHFFPTFSIGTALLLFKIPVFTAGVIILGHKTGLRTIISMLAISGFIDFFSFIQIPFPYPLLAAITGGMMMGGGASLIIKGGGSTGGFSVLGQISNLKLGYPIGKTIFVLNFFVLTLTIIIFGLNTFFYTLINIFANSSTIDLLKTKQREKGL